MPSIYSTSSIPQGIQIYANATLFPVTAQDGEQAVAADTNTLYIYDTSVPGWQAVANPGAAIAIDALTGEVTATGPGVVAATISNAAVTNAKLAAMADNTVKGNKSGGPASPSDLALADVAESVSNVLQLANNTNAVVGTGNLTIQVKQSSAMQDGYLSSTDWTTFNSKQNALTIGNLSGDTNANISISGGTGAVIGTGTSISQSAATSLVNGYLTSTDWGTFNSKVSSVSGSAPISSSGGTTPTISISNFVGATNLVNGSAGAVPAPQAGEEGYYLKGNGLWSAISTLPAYSQDKVLYSTASAAEWRTVGTGSTDSSYPTNTVILGRTKPASLSGTENTIIGSLAATNATTAQWNTIIGYNAAPTLTTGIRNVIIGDQISTGTNPTFNTIVGSSIGLSGSPTQSVFIGNSVGAYTSNTAYCVIIGSGAGGGNQAVNVGQASSSGDYGVVIGKAAVTYTDYGTSIGYGAKASAGSYAVTVGALSGSGFSGTVNTIVGGNSAKALTTGTNNTLVGQGVATTLTSGSSNTVMGAASFNSASLTTAANNTIVGAASATALTVGSNNCILGQGLASALTSGTHNIVIGVESLNAATSSTYCTAIGYQAAQTNNTGNRVIAIGYQAGQSVNNALDAICIGTLAGAGGSGKSGSISIGYNAGHNSAHEAICIGRYAGYSSGGGSYGVAIGAEALNYANGSYSIGIGYWAGRGAASSNSVFIGKWAGQASVANDEFYLGNQNYANNAAEKTNSLMYGTFNATAASQTLSLNAQVNLAYGERHAVATKTATPISVAASDYTIAVDTATIAGASAVNLPAISAGDAGRVYVIKDLTGSAATNNITVNVAAGSGNLIDGASSQTISVAYGSLTLQSDGSNRWMIL